MYFFCNTIRKVCFVAQTLQCAVRSFRSMRADEMSGRSPGDAVFAGRSLVRCGAGMERARCNFRAT
jgi:hypothetical protein